MKLKDLVNKNFRTFVEETPYIKVLKEFEKHKLNYSIITNIFGKVVGIITGSDLYNVAFPGFNELHSFVEYDSIQMSINERNKEIYQKPINVFMTKNPEYIDEKESIIEAAAIMKAYKIKQLLVYEDENLLGVITIHDLIKNIIIKRSGRKIKNRLEEIEHGYKKEML